MEKLKKWSLIAEIIGGIAIVFSIMYLAIEVQSNTNAVQSQTAQGLSELVMQLDSTIAANADLADLYLRSSEDLESVTEVERFRYFLVKQQLMGVWEIAYSSHAIGTLSDEIWAGWDSNIKNLLCLDSNHQIWIEAESNFSPEFRAYVNSLLANDCE